MISVTEEFKTQQKGSARQVRAKVADLTESDDLKSFKITASGNPLKSIMRQAEATYLGSHDYLDTYIHLQLGVEIPTMGDDLTLPIYDDAEPPNITGYYQKVVSSTPEYIDYGSFKVVEFSVDEATGNSKIKMFDKMYEAQKLYSLPDINYPTTLGVLLFELCNELDWDLDMVSSASFPNVDLTIDTELFSESRLTFRQVLDMIAEASGSIIYFNTDDILCLKQISITGSIETLTSANLLSLKLESEYGQVNSVVLSRQPQEDNILKKNEASIAGNGLTELKISNNLIVDSDRETYISPIFDTLFGLNYYPFTARTVGLGYFQIGDRIELTDPSGNLYETIILNWTLEVAGGIRETIGADVPNLDSTNYKTAGVIGQAIKKTEITVNKQTGEIILLNETTDGLTTSISTTASEISTVASTVAQNTIDITAINEDVTTLQQDSASLTLQVEGIGGNNLLKNSVGLKGTIEEWQIFDGNGALVDATNTGTVVRDSNTTNFTESGSGIQITDTYITQTVPTIIGEVYTFYCKYVQTEPTTYATITGTEGNIDFDETVLNWTVFKYQFTATDNQTTLKIGNSGGGLTLLSDMIIKKGDCNGWTQAPNEVYGMNFRFDKDGFSITSLTDAFKSVLDNRSLSVFDTSSGSDKVMMSVDIVEALLTNLKVQDYFVLQRYGNASKAMRMIPTSTGVMLVIND